MLTIVEAIPLKQGLKPYAAGCNLRFYNIVEAIPLKQGLKPNVGDNVYLKDDNIVEAIPLKQGLKLKAKVILIIAHAGLLRLFH